MDKGKWCAVKRGGRETGSGMSTWELACLNPSNPRNAVTDRLLCEHSFSSHAAPYSGTALTDDLACDHTLTGQIWAKSGTTTAVPAANLIVTTAVLIWHAMMTTF